MENRPTPSSFSTDKPFLSLLNIDLLVLVMKGTFFHPFFVWMVPLALRAVTFQYHHPPLWGSILYSSLVTLWFVFTILDKRIAFGAARKVKKMDEVMVITGGSSGLGLLIAQVYGMKGVGVAILDIVEPEVEVMNVEYYKCDVGDNEQVKEAAKKIREDLGEPTVLINNAGIVNGKSVLNLTTEEIERTFQTNVLAHFYTIKQFLPDMIKLGRGTIVTVSSVLAHIGPKQTSDYAASKAAVRLLHNSLTAEVAEHPNIKTLLVSPGQFSTPLFEGVETPSNFFAPIMEPIEVAREIIAAIDSGSGGEIALPLYSRWIVVMQCLPASLQRFIRWVSGCDRAMRTFTGRRGSITGQQNGETQ